ncbi:ferritin-like domain-containing protein [Fodinibius salsisoli]|uniref:Ferritin-like domain-containing protein n=1 Tax=Fodinibius salsisoli TaxID=2820877 RepID=A0ABT3PJ51_9BACT|nr:ferritin-like domain-containing protein [Fodinibius salsisoli]MCW9705929.1 ferritin-like domain-containing protein [Fodinibius salsisoli]
MNFLDLINDVDADKLNGESKDKFLSRKQALGKLSNFSKKLAVTALPLGAFAAFSKPAQAQSTDQLVDTLNFALTLEYLEAEYYQKGIDSGIVDSYGKVGGVSAQAHGDTFREIADHEADHVAFLTEVIGNVLGGEPAQKPTFDFTVDGAFDPFNNNAQFLALAQAFEDTGVRAYKGQAGAVMGNDLVLTRALQIHSVEARHASRVRELRGLKGWITGDSTEQSLPEAAQAVYEGETPETNTTQVVDVSATLSGDGDVDNTDIAAAWDEFLTKDEVLAIASLFIVEE